MRKLTSCNACPHSGTMWGFSPGRRNEKLRGSRQTGQSSSSSRGSWLETTGTGAATIAAYGWIAGKASVFFGTNESELFEVVDPS